MQQDIADKLLSALSGERLGGYQGRLKDHGNGELFAHYTWNMALSESLYPSLQMLEIVFRNTIHKAASRYFGQPDWYDDSRIVRPKDLDMVANVKQSLQGMHRPPEPSRVVAALSFGFWTAMMDRRYEQVLWPRLLQPCFPHMPRRLRTRKNVSARFERIRRLRNRVFHHEPIWHWHDLAEQHQDMLEAIAWIEPAARDFVAAIDRFPSLHQEGPAAIESRLRQFD